MFPFAVLSTVILYYAVGTAEEGGRVGALNERAFIALDICFMLGSGALLTINRLTDHAFFPTAVAAPIFSVSLIILGLIPINWVRLWYQGKLGQDDAA